MYMSKHSRKDQNLTIIVVLSNYLSILTVIVYTLEEHTLIKALDGNLLIQRV